MQNYIVYGKSPVESTIIHDLFKNFSRDEILEVRSDKDLTSVLSTIRYRPIFGDRWLLNVKVDKLSPEKRKTVFGLLKNDRVSLYLKIEQNKALFNSARKSKTLNDLPNLRILNLQYPDDQFLKSYIFERTHKYFDDKVLRYIIKELRYNMENIDTVIDSINDTDSKYVTMDEVKNIIRHDRRGNVRELCFCLLLAHRNDLKERWKESKVYTFAGTKRKPFEILDNLHMNDFYLLKYATETLQQVLDIKHLLLLGKINPSIIFSHKESLGKTYPIIKDLAIPVILNYLAVSEETTKRDIQYCLNEFLSLQSKKFISREDILLVVYKLMNRR